VSEKPIQSHTGGIPGLVLASPPQIVRRGVRGLLCEKYWFCGEAQDGAEAVKESQELQPILDVSMPVMNGLEAAH
jgi:YesN/AraC family two-component response regulator